MRMFFHDPGGLPYMTAISVMIAKELTCRAPYLRALKAKCEGVVLKARVLAILQIHVDFRQFFPFRTQPDECALHTA